MLPDPGRPYSLPHPDMVNPSAKRTIIASCLCMLPSCRENPCKSEPGNWFRVARRREIVSTLHLCIPTPVHYNREFRLDFHGTDGVGSDRAAHLSAARGRSAGHAVYSRGRQGARGCAVGEEVEAALWRSAGTDDVRARVL